MICKNLEINGKKVYCGDYEDFLRELFINKVIDLYTYDTIKEEIDKAINKDESETVSDLKEQINDLESDNEDLEDKVTELEDKISKIRDIVDDDLTL